jgi:hypothetical protein
MSGDSTFKTCWKLAGGDPYEALWLAISLVTFELKNGKRCECGCMEKLEQQENGRPRRFATDACRQRAYRQRMNERLS